MREEHRFVSLSKPVQDRVSLIQKITTPKAVRLRTISALNQVCLIPVGCENMRYDSFANINFLHATIL